MELDHVDANYAAFDIADEGLMSAKSSGAFHLRKPSPDSCLLEKVEQEAIFGSMDGFWHSRLRHSGL